MPKTTTIPDRWLQGAMAGGAKRVVMLGYDCQHTGGRAHWHPDHGGHLGNAKTIDRWWSAYAALRERMTREGMSMGGKTGTATITETTQSGKGVILPLAGYRKFGNANIVAGDETLLLSGLNSAGAALTTPHVDDSLTDAGGNVFALVAVDPLHPAGLDILYDCVIRRAA